MQQLNKSLVIRLLFVTLLSVVLVVSVGLIGWQSTLRIGQIGTLIGDAEEQEVLVIQIENLVHSTSEKIGTSDATLDRIRSAIAAFEQGQVYLREQNQAADDFAEQQVLITLDDTDAQWVRTRALLETYLSANDTERLVLEPRILEQTATTYVYADRVSNALEAVTQRQQQNVILIFTGAGVVTIIAAGLSISVLLQTIRSMQGLTGIARALSGGIYSVRADLNTLSEIAQVGAAMNLMAETVQSREADLRHANESLEQRVKERTVELEKATAEAREASRAKDEFLSVMSHELRTPLNAILGYQGILELVGGLNGDNLEMVQRTEANARRLLGLINDVLDISRIEAGRMEIVPSRLAIKDFVDHIQAQMEVLATEKQIAFDVNIAEKVPQEIVIDEDALSKIVINLLGNAFKFTDEGRVGMDIMAQNGSLQLAVSDTGIGIPAHMHQIIFERFRQADSSSTRNYGGSGLGLSIVQQLCNMMGGTVVVDSTIGSGSTFTVTLPLQAAEMERV